MAPLEQDPANMEQAFERSLLDSARSDGVTSAAAESAWRRFSAELSAATISAGVARGAAHGPLQTSALTRLSAAKYLLVGLLGGSALTFAWIGQLRPGPSETAAGHSAETAAGYSAANLPTPALSPSVLAPRLPSAVGSSAHIEAAPPSRAASTRPRAPLAHPAGAALAADHLDAPPAPALENPEPERVAAGAPDSRLAAEVSALDAARAAAQAGAYDRALELLEQYQLEFPAGLLQREARVAAIQALYSKGDRDEARRRAAQFVAEFPNDPHAATVRRFAAR